MGLPRALIFDLDDTLLDWSGMAAAVARTAELIAGIRTHIDARQLTAANASVWTTYWPEVESDWMLGVRTSEVVGREAWRRSLAACDIEDDELTEYARETFAREERASHRLYDDARDVIANLGEAYELAIVTNGARDSQRQNLRTVGIEDAFRVDIVSAEVGLRNQTPRSSISRCGSSVSRRTRRGTSATAWPTTSQARRPHRSRQSGSTAWERRARPPIRSRMGRSGRSTSYSPCSEFEHHATGAGRSTHGAVSLATDQRMAHRRSAGDLVRGCSMAVQTISRYSRRALLGAGVGAAGALVAQALGRPLPTRAVNGDPVVVGGNHSATSVTKISNTASDGTAIAGLSSGGTGIEGSTGAGKGVAGNAEDGIGVYGTSATGTGIVGGSDASGIGVFGRSVSGIGAFGSSDHFLGVLGTSDSFENPALAGSSLGLNTGVVGFSGPAVEGQRVVPPTPANTGVYGLAVTGPASRGVTGETRMGRAVNGIATSGVALYGAAASGHALQTDGRIRLERSSGKVFLKAGTRSVAVTPGVDLTNRSMVFATLQGRVDGSTTVQRVVINSATDTFTIFLTENALRTVVVAWLLLS